MGLQKKGVRQIPTIHVLSLPCPSSDTGGGVKPQPLIAAHPAGITHGVHSQRPEGFSPRAGPQPADLYRSPSSPLVAMVSAPPSERDTSMSPARRPRQRPHSTPPPALTPHPPLLTAPTWFTAGSCCKDASRLKETHRKQRKSSGRKLPPLTRCPLEQLWDPKMGQAGTTPAGLSAHAEHPATPQTGTASEHA